MPIEALPACWRGDAVEPTLPYKFSDGIRPWNWTELDALNAGLLWSTLMGFVAWFNARYGERSDKRIPSCWAEHGPLVEELTTLCLARWHAFDSGRGSVGGAQYWHSSVLPGFYERMREWLGDDLLACQQGRHRPNVEGDPGRSPWRPRTGDIAERDGTRRVERKVDRAAADVQPFSTRLESESS